MKRLERAQLKSFKMFLGYLLFIPLLTALLIIIANTFPYNNSMDNFFNRVLPLGGHLLGQEPEAWIGDTLGKRVVGKRGEPRPASADVDFIKVKNKWYKMKGPVYITQSGRILGWHRETTLEETGYKGRRSFVE